MATIPLNEKANIVDNMAIEAKGGPGVALPPVPPTVSGKTPSPKPMVSSNPTPNLSPGAIADIQAGIKAAQAEYLRIKGLADNLGSQQKTSASNLTSSSASVVANENKTKSEVASLTPPSTSTNDAQAASNAYMAMLQSQWDMLEQRRQQEVANINASFDATKKATEAAQKNEVGATSAGLARIGGYLGGSASSTGAMLKLVETHRNELLGLEAKRQAAISEAQNAITDKQFEIAKLKAQEAKAVEKEINDRKNKFFDQQLELAKEERQQDEYLRTKYKDELATLATLGTETSPEKMDEIDSFYGVEGFTKRYLEVTNAANKIKNEKEAIEARKNLVDLLTKIPAGQTIEFPDGTQYTGMGSASDVYTTMQTDASGNGYIITHNKLTGATNVTNVGQVGKPSGGGSGGNESSVAPAERDNVRAMVQIRLEESKGKEGYDPDAYIRERNMVKEAYPQMVEYLDKIFLNPSYGFFNQDAIVRLRKKGIYVQPNEGDPIVSEVFDQNLIDEDFDEENG